MLVDAGPDNQRFEMKEYTDAYRQTDAAALTLPSGAARVRIFKPVSNGAKAVSTLGAVAAGGQVRLTGAVAIPDHPLIIEITPHSHKK